MFGRIGVPEIVVLLIMSAFWVIPLVVAVWAIVTLHRVRRDQETLLAKLDVIEKRLPR
jgi:hypothetical protein